MKSLLQTGRSTSPSLLRKAALRIISLIWSVVFLGFVGAPALLAAETPTIEVVVVWQTSKTIDTSSTTIGSVSVSIGGSATSGAVVNVKSENPRMSNEQAARWAQCKQILQRIATLSAFFGSTEGNTKRASASLTDNARADWVAAGCNEFIPDETLRAVQQHIVEKVPG